MNHEVAGALRLLRVGTGIPDARFREGQEEAIRHVVEGRGRLLVVRKTGWGKSFVYFIAARLLRQEGAGPTLIVSPLLALMRNQILAAERMGLRAVTINSDNFEKWSDIEKRITQDEVDLLLIAPERFANEHFRTDILAPLAARVALLVIDEAHCISDWGHDFRPHYRLIERIVRILPPNLRLLATTATANDRVMDDLQEVLGPDITVSRGDLARPSLCLQTIRLVSQAERLAWLAEQVPRLDGSGVIYTLTVRDAKGVADWLSSRGIDVAPYYGAAENRAELEDTLLANEIKALVATTALGMGFDKPDLAFVIHYQTPGSAVAYYQQVGRAGRALPSAFGVLLAGEEDEEINDFFITSAFPTQEEVRQVLAAIEANPEGLSIPGLMAGVNISGARIEKTVSLLSLESPAPIIKQGTKWQLTAACLQSSFWERAERLTTLRRQEQRGMQEYADLESGHMAYLIRALDGDPADLTTPDLPPLPATTSTTVVRDAVEFLRRTSLDIEIRKRWPLGGLSRYELKGGIAERFRAKRGKALCIWGDAGWGELVRQGKFRDKRFSDELVDACVRLVRQWQPQPPPSWVTAIPSLRHPDLVPDFARRLAAALGLPFRMVLTKVDDRPEQKTMANSTQQARNVDGSMAVEDDEMGEEPVLLIDDMVDSRWTLTIGAWLLLDHGCGPVHPLALALTG